MGIWTCISCSETIEPEFDTCWNCGTHHDGSPADDSFVRDDAPAPDRDLANPRDLHCLRCQGTMRIIGRKRFHEGSQALPFLLGDLGELFINRQSFDVFACGSCGKVELFVTDLPIEQPEA